MMKLSKKFVFGLGFILIANSLFAIEIENLKNSDNEQTKVTQKCAIDNQSSDYKKAFFEKYQISFSAPYPMYFDKGFVVNYKVYIFDKDVRNSIDKVDYMFCNTIKSKDSIKLSKDITNLMFEYYSLNKQLVQLDNFKLKFEKNPFPIKTMDKESLLKLIQSMSETLLVLNEEYKNENK